MSQRSLWVKLFKNGKISHDSRTVHLSLLLREISQAWHANADAWGSWLCATRFALPRSAKLALLSERISDHLRFAFQVDGQMHVLMSWLIWSQKSKEPPSWTKEEYEGGQIGLQDPVLCILPQISPAWPTAENSRDCDSQTWMGWTCATLLEQPLVHKCLVSAPASFSAAPFPPSLRSWIKTKVEIQSWKLRIQIKYFQKAAAFTLSGFSSFDCVFYCWLISA